MAVITLIKPVYNKNQYEKVINTSFTQLVNVSSSLSVSLPVISVDQFFQYYQDLFYIIPELGDINSHQYLVITSGAYIGSTTPTDNTIQALIEEVTQLKQENLDLQQQIISGSVTI
jgi:hypothetical protein